MKATKDNGFLKVAQQAHLKSEHCEAVDTVRCECRFYFFFTQTNLVNLPVSTFSDKLHVTKCNLL